MVYHNLQQAFGSSSQCRCVNSSLVKPPMPFAHVVTAGGNTCDFCTCIAVFKAYPCKTFKVRGIPVFHTSEGLWAACWKCAEFVDAEKWPDLTERAFQLFMQKHAVPRHDALEVKMQFADMVKLFSLHKIV